MAYVSNSRKRACLGNKYLWPPSTPVITRQLGNSHCLGMNTELSRRSTNLSEEEEYPVPEQFKTTIGIMGLVTVALEHGH
ncbi:unnamed protein product [Timema podura]|uniref:Uncharacterized protein n=1 Tax=Timema podura TaxID=61482 RepID=A0ABN7NXY1_TIMPD|nr:unnamed protein product [Timema podura]